MRTLLFFVPIVFLVACGLLNSEANKPDIPGKIVFAANDENGRSQIYTMDANGTNLRQLTHFEKGGSAAQPSWSPDGSRIVFANYTDATTLGPYLYIMDADGSNMRILKRYSDSSLKGLIGNFPDWSPDGTKIAYSVCTNCEMFGNNYEISTVEVAGEVYKPDKAHAITDHPSGDFSPEWSPMVKL